MPYRGLPRCIVIERKRGADIRLSRVIGRAPRM
jgi:hypothetical protein